MPNWAISRFITFNLTVLVVGIIFAVLLYRKRTLKAAIGGIFGALIISGLLVLFTQMFQFFLVTLACAVLFVHLPLWLTTATVLLWRNHRWFSITTILLVVALWAVAYDAFLYEPTALEVTRYEFTDPRIEKPMRIVVIADFQTDQIGEYERHVLETVLEQKPDLILFAGDYFAARNIREWHAIQDQFVKLAAKLDFDAPLGVYAIQGNVDSWFSWPMMFRNMKGQRATTLSRSFDIDGIRLTCLAERDSFNTRLELKRDKKDRFHIVLGHAPNYALGNIDADLLLAGHTHGGQIRLPGIGPLSTGCQVPRDLAAGMNRLPELPDRQAPRHLIVSRGTGMERGFAPRIRFLCRPELVVIDLKPEKSTQKNADEN